MIVGVKEQTPAQQAAVAALRALPRGLGERTAAAAIQEYLSEFADRTFGKQQKSKAARWWGWVLGKRFDWADTLSWTLPGDDHVEWREKEGRRYHISHPYSVAWDDLRDLVHHCEANGLEVSLSGVSWYFPGSTLRGVVEKSRKD